MKKTLSMHSDLKRTDKQTKRHTDKVTERQTGKQTDRYKTNTHTHS
jgi:hypothetical protein